jgi:hypothetical protein
MTSTTSTTSGLLRRLVSAALLAASTVLGVGMLADPAVAAAERVLDIGEYDECYIRLLINYPDWPEKSIRAYCCAVAGGDWDKDADNGAGDCFAPPADDGGAEAPITLPPGAITQLPPQTAAVPRR